MPNARRATNWDRWPAFRSPSKTCCAPKTCRRPARRTCFASFRPPYDATVIDKAAQRRCRDRRQDEHGRVRDGGQHRNQRLWRHAKPLGHDADPRRQQRRGGGLRGRRHRPAQLGNAIPADRFVSRPAFCGVTGIETDLRSRQPVWAWSRLPAAWTRSVRWPGRSKTSPCCCRRSPATNRVIRHRSIATSPTTPRCCNRPTCVGMRIGVLA